MRTCARGCLGRKDGRFSLPWREGYALIRLLGDDDGRSRGHDAVLLLECVEIFGDT